MGYTEEKTGKEFGEPFGLKALRLCLPLSGSFELTWRCNLRCRHCYIPHYNSEEKELSGEDITDILRQLQDGGCLWLLITGGEPLLRNDFTDIYICAKKMGLLITLFTNGTLLNEGIVSLLSDYPPSSIEITLYGASQATYEMVTGIPGSFRRCISGIEMLREKGLNLSLKTMIMALNQHELKSMKDFASRLGLNFRYDAELNPRLDACKSPCQLRLSPEEVVTLDSEDEERLRELRKLYRESPEGNDFENLYICSAAKTNFHIDPYGNLSSCLMARNPFYNLRESSFEKGWKTLVQEIRNKKPSPGYRCGACQLLYLCGQCPGWAEMENNNEEKPIDYLCEITHLRAKFLEEVKK